MSLPHPSTWNIFDVIVVGGGHAGIEAAYAAARMGCKTLMLTVSRDRIGWMPCNPAVGGIGKGHIVFEISALGGLMPQLCTKTYLQARMLNTKKGPAVHGLRLQIDKYAYNRLAISALEKTPNLTIAMQMVEKIIQDAQGNVTGIQTREGAIFHAQTVILTTGTFMNGLVHIGTTHYTAGRQGEEASTGLPAWLAQSGLEMKRLKTGTPPRLLKSSLDFSRMQEQRSDDLTALFEFEPHHVEHKVSCFVTHTTEKTHEIIRQNAHLSPIYSGLITGTPPRYCPSIEDKISRFASKDSHHVFVEPEGAASEEVYPNGLSTSLPITAQRAFIQSIPGFENAIITRPGYAIEYDCVLPHQLSQSLEVKKIPGLFLAGQINGTTGYEEAAGQGIIAGINAASKVLGKEPFIISRQEGYIGIMIDDLVTMGIDEPYRMFTSRAERRLILRQDNTFARLGPKAHAYGLISDERAQKIEQENQLVQNTIEKLRVEKKLLALVQRLSNGEHENVLEDLRALNLPSERTLNSVFAEILYGPYLDRERKEIEKMHAYQKLEIPDNFSYENIPGLSKELTQKLSRYRPATIAQTALIQGMTPAAISLLIFRVQEYLKNGTNKCTPLSCN